MKISCSSTMIWSRIQWRRNQRQNAKKTLKSLPLGLLEIVQREKENTTTVGESKTESVNIEHIKSTEQERTYRREVSDIESQSKTAEMSTIDTKSHSTEFRQDSSETRSTSDLEFTSRKTHERNTTSTNENLTQRDTFRQEQSNDKSRTDQSIHEQITSDENEVSFGTRSSTAHEEKRERVTGINKSKLTTESLSTTDNIRDFDNYTNTKIRSETERTEHSEIDERANEVNNLKETQKQTTNSESKTESTNETKKKDDSTNISSSEKSGVGSKNTVDDSLGVGTSSSLSIGATEEIRGGGGARIWGGIKTDTDYLIPLPQFGGVSASSNIGGGISGTVTNENSMNLNTNHKTNDSSTISSSLDTDLTVAKSKTELNQGTKSTDKTKATDESDTTSDSNKESKTKTIQDTKSTTNIHSTDDRSETGKTTEHLTSKLEDVTTRTEQFERTQKSVSDTKREEEFNDTRHTVRENVRDIKSIQESINTQESTSQINETVRDRIESRVKETGELEEFGTRQEKKYETSDRITKSERESTSHEERYGETMTASVEQRITKTFAETDKETETHKKTVGFRTEKEFREQELHSTESAQEQERGKQRSVETIENAVREKENVIRQLITKDTEKMKETSMSEEYRKRLNDVITSRNELLNQLRKEKDEIQRSNKENTTKNTEGSATTVGTTAERNKTDKERDENASAVVTQTSTEVEISQEMLRLKIIDVIGRFAGIASEYLNNFDLKRGPDVVFAIDNPLLGTVVEKTIQWGFLETPCPEDSLSVPQILFSDLYEEDFWSEVIEMGLLEHLRIILTPIEANSQIEISCPNFIYKTNRKNNTSMASQLATLELQGPLDSKNRPSLSFTDSMFRMFADRDKFCHITTLNLSGLELRFSNERDNINMSCSTLKSINLTLCHVGSGSACPTGENTPVSLSLILQYFAGNLAVEAAFPQLLEFSFRNPCSDSAGGVAVWEVEDYCLELFERLNFLDITKTRVVADAVEKLFGYGADSTSGNAAISIGKKRIGFGETLSTLVLDGCTVDGELRIPSEEETSGGSGSSGSKMKVLDSVKNGLKLNCFNLKPVESARIVSFWANEASKRTGKTVQIL
ncbi:hypothetical protein BDR26DRAFT_178993 [Obelidium mucronatum]|nr:hypothetical protein BDR26DRAFT_178993 [Obelidium mucronatum]